jgi:hypothetical protein
MEPHLMRRRPHVHVYPTQPVPEEALAN